MMASTDWRTWLRRMLPLLALIGLWTTLPYAAVRTGTSLFMRLDGRHSSAESALDRLTVMPHDGFKPMYPDRHGYEILQRQVLKYPAGILYALGWRDSVGQTCMANVFIEKIRDMFEGWKRRGAWGHCSAQDQTAWVTGFGEYDGFSVANGLSGDAALVKVTWRAGNITYKRPINGVYMSVLDRDGARASLVEFLDATGALQHSIKPYS